jgi:predicted alpha/beta superfamily hydrolase
MTFRIFYLSIALTLIFFSTESAQTMTDSLKMAGIKSFNMKSINVNDIFVIDVSLPASYSENTDMKYPVLYLTDGYWRRKQHKPIHDMAETENIQEMIIVAVGYPDNYKPDIIRQRDLLSGADNFLSFIIHELIPYIDSNYRTIKTERTLWGASFGGYFAMYALFHCNEITQNIFKNYIVASPDAYQKTKFNSGDLNLFDYENMLFEKTRVMKENLYLAVGGSEEARFINSFDGLVKVLEGRNYDGFFFKSFKDPGKTHFTVWEPALYEGIRMFMKKDGR